jgi:uncharacterized protein YfaS (alpha-2-macroglobulin family)
MDETIGVENVADELTEIPIDLSDALDGETGHLIVVVEPPSGLFSDNRREPVHPWVQVTNIGLDAVSDHSRLIAWATNLEDGSPLSGVELELAPGGGTATTGSDGLAEFTLGRGAYLIARHDGQTAILPSNPYYYDVEGWRSWTPESELRWYVIDDRQMYRPGEEVHVKGWLRIIGAGQTGDVEMPNGLEGVRYTLIGSQGNEILSGEAEVTALGGFDMAFTLPDNANLGFATLMLNSQGSMNISHGHE